MGSVGGGNNLLIFGIYQPVDKEIAMNIISPICRTCQPQNDRFCVGYTNYPEFTDADH